jgi:hypothetical protein
MYITAAVGEQAAAVLYKVLYDGNLAIASAEISVEQVSYGPRLLYIFFFFLYTLLFTFDVMCVHSTIYFTATTDLLLGVGKSKEEEDTLLSPTKPYITPPSPGFFPL